MRVGVEKEMTEFFKAQFPMPQPEFSPDGSIWYMCPLGCGWQARRMTPENKNLAEALDTYMTEIRVTVSDHYRNNHGVE